MLLEFVKPMRTSVYGSSLGIGSPGVPRKGDEGHLGLLEL